MYVLSTTLPKTNLKVFVCNQPENMFFVTYLSDTILFKTKKAANNYKAYYKKSQRSLKTVKVNVHVLIISEQFPKSHPRAGEATNFVEKINNKEKIHTIRQNYAYWLPKIKEIQEGKAVLSVRVWTGKPYKSKQKEVFRLCKNSGIGIEKINLFSINYDYCVKSCNDMWFSSSDLLPRNDGLSITDFRDWFVNSKYEDDKAIIHFGDFRYAELPF